MNYSIVVPVYKSNNTLPILHQEIMDTLQKTGVSFEIIYVNDCSPDDSWEILKSIQQKDDNVKILRLANNVGQWMATLAGISRTKGDLIITIDDDLEYVTSDILKLIDCYNNNDVHLVYGIPLEKKNKNISYKLFFVLRDKFLQFFFNKIKTESFKIFNRKIYFSNGKMVSNLHFEAYTKFVVSANHIKHIDVGYRRRYEGESSHTLWMKIKMLDKYGIEYFKSPFKYLLYLILTISILEFILGYFNFPYTIHGALKLLVYFSIITMSGILGKYLSSIYFKNKGLPEYVIIEEI